MATLFLHELRYQLTIRTVHEVLKLLTSTIWGWLMSLAIHVDLASVQGMVFILTCSLELCHFDFLIFSLLDGNFTDVCWDKTRRKATYCHQHNFPSPTLQRCTNATYLIHDSYHLCVLLLSSDAFVSVLPVTLLIGLWPVLSLDAIDMSGKHEVDLDTNIWKVSDIWVLCLTSNLY